MANKKTIDEALEIRKSLLTESKFYGIPSMLFLATITLSIALASSFNPFISILLGIFTLVSFYTIHRKDPKAIQVAFEVATKGCAFFSPFKQSHKKLALKNAKGLCFFYNQPKNKK